MRIRLRKPLGRHRVGAVIEMAEEPALKLIEEKRASRVHEPEAAVFDHPQETARMNKPKGRGRK